MALAAIVEDGKIVESGSQSSLSTGNTNNSGMDKDSFLQLLVAQMKYQDPLEPTSNTEFVSQYAQFSQVESMQNMAGNMELQRASSLVGQEVYVETTSSTGSTYVVKGKVDYVSYENGKAYLSIDDSLYSIDDLLHVVDKDYIDAVEMASAFVIDINKLPAVNGIDMNDAEAIDKLEETYNNMTDYQKQFVASDKVKDLEAYVERLKEIRAAAEEAEAKKVASELTKGLDNLPSIEELTLEEEEALAQLEKIYAGMSDYQKTFVEEDDIKLLDTYLAKMKELKEAADEEGDLEVSGE